jgi:hypothetical protein
MPRRRVHRAVFVAAGLYNVAWGAYSALDPQWLFRFAHMPPANHPQVFACLGMVVGLYGILYLEVARAPERGWLLAAVGLVGKVLGPQGLGHLIWTGTWPARAAVLSLTNDVIWWAPFALYLHDAWPSFRASTAAPPPSAAAGTARGVLEERAPSNRARPAGNSDPSAGFCRRNEGGASGGCSDTPPKN